MFKDARRNWQTTLAGIIAGAVPIVVAWLKGEVTIEALLTGVGIAILGVLAKDGNKSGTADHPVP